MPFNYSYAGSSATRFNRLTFALLCSLLLPATACKSHAGHTSDPQLRKIDDLIDAQLPAGTPFTRVSFFLSSRGYPLDPSRDPHTIIAVIRHVDTQTLQPITARVTFHFDEHDKLISYNLVPAPDVPFKP
jgi:hypothetical protein